MKTMSEIIKNQQILASEKMDEANKYIEFSKKYFKKNDVSGPFDAKFKGDKAKQKEFMEGLSKAWSEYKEEKGMD